MRFKCKAVEIAAQDKDTIVLDIIPNEAEEGMFGLEVADLQGAIDLGMEAGTTTGERQFRLAQRQIFQSLPVVEVGQAVQGELFGIRQDGQSITLGRHRCRALLFSKLSI